MDNDYNSYYFTGIGLIFTIIVILWIKNIAVVKKQPNDTKKDKCDKVNAG